MDLGPIAERWRQLQTARHAAARAAADARRPIDGRDSPAPAVGSRVFDPQTGLEGEVVHATQHTVTDPTPQP